MPTARFLSCCCIAVLAVAATVATKARGSTFDDALESEGLGTFQAALQSGIAVKEKHAWTILAPTDAAFTARLNASLGMSTAELLRPANRDTLQQVLSYHIIPSGSFLSAELENCQQLLTWLKDTPPLTARVSITTAKVFAASGGSQQQKALRLSLEGATNSARVLKPDIEAGSSVVHIIDDVLLPRGVGKGAVLQYYPSFESVLTGAKLKTMMAAVQASGITLSPEQRYTILAPTDAAFATRLRKSLGMQPSDLLAPANADRLHKILSYHILPRGNLLSSNLKDGQKVCTSLQGAAPLTVQRSCNSITFQGAAGKAHVTAADVRAGRDIVVHVVDDVLLPAA
ncbi:hypothetical protein OEZ86_007499 [Tetradesmus obliquus]|nr:hypothetical protein OEZ86_007499 [Tetradesmus obliquus]